MKRLQVVMMVSAGAFGAGAGPVPGEESASRSARGGESLRAEVSGRAAEALAEAEAKLGEVFEADPANPEALQRRGEERSFAGKFADACEDFDRVVELRPDSAPYNWQRGIALYGAGRYRDGFEQFEAHDSVNPRDVENAVWRFACQARLEGAEKARADLLPYRGDGRVPMREIHALFAGTGTEAAVLEAANAGDGDSEVSEADRRNRLCYAHLYLGLLAHALGNSDEAEPHFRKAAVDCAMPHYMGKIATACWLALTDDEKSPASSPDEPLDNAPSDP